MSRGITDADTTRLRLAQEAYLRYHMVDKTMGNLIGKIRGTFISFLIFCLSFEKVKFPCVSLIIQGRGQHHFALI